MICLMNHNEKVQMLDEVAEIRSLLLQLHAPENTDGQFVKGTFNVPVGKRILDLF